MEVQTKTRVANRVIIQRPKRSSSGTQAGLGRAIGAIASGHWRWEPRRGRGAIGALAIRALAVKRGKIQRLDIEELEVGRLRVRELVVERE